MGEIADALKRAQAERNAETQADSERGDRPAEASRRPRAPSVAEFAKQFLDEGEQVGPAASLPKEPTEAIELSHRTPEAIAPQYVVIEGNGPVTESCRQLALRVVRELERRSVRTLAVVSALRDEGKTVTSCNLALALASLSRGRQVALVDLDLRRPSIATVLELPPREVGIEGVLVGEHALDEVVVSVAKPALDVYPVSRPQAEAHELLIQAGLAAIVRELTQRYSVVIFDTPPTLLVPDTNLILEHVSAYAPVARAGHTRARSFRRMLEILPRERLLGEVLNGGALPSHSSDYGYYYYRAQPAEPAGGQEAPSTR